MDSTRLDPFPHDSFPPVATPAPRDDLSALAWVVDELRRSLEAAHKALRRFVRESEASGGAGVEAVDPALLRTARMQLHQGVGALELVGLPAAAVVLGASEAAVQRFVERPRQLTAKVAGQIEHASFALLDYLGRRLAGTSLSPLALFPQYRAVQEAASAERVHPADLWQADWRWRELPPDGHAAALQPDATTRGALEAQLLALMRGGASPLAAAARMGDLCAGLGTGAADARTATLWKLAAAVFEAQSRGLLGFDVFSKRVASRLLAQFRTLERGGSEVSEQLARDLLFFCAQSAAPGDDSGAPRLAAVRRVYSLARHTPTDYAVSPLGRFDPALIVQARKRVAVAKEAWAAVAAGEMHRLAGLPEQFALVGELLERLFPLGEAFAAELQHAASETQQSGTVPAAALAMEVATSLLYVEAALGDSDFDTPEQSVRVQRLAERLSSVRRGRAPEPLEGWMEELYRRVSDRQTLGSVVQELRASLSESEQLIDQFFRNPADRDLLIPVPQQLSAMRGVLSVLGMDHASHALLRMRDEVDGLVSTEVDPQRVAQAGVFDRLASNLGALGFLIDMLAVQPQMAKSLFTYDPDSGRLSPVMGRGAPEALPAPPAMPAPSATPATSAFATGAASAPIAQHLIEQAQMLAFTSVRQDVTDDAVSRDLERLARDARAADQYALSATVAKARQAFERAANPDELAAARGELSEALVEFVATANEPSAPEREPHAEPEPPPPARVSAPIALDFGAAELEDDAEMRAIFLEEAREVLAGAQAARVELVEAADALAPLTTLRRAFHTLKGSGRMVGLNDFGEAAWICEQLYNTHLADPRSAGPGLLDFTAWALGYLSAWVDAIAALRPTGHDVATVKAAAAGLAEVMAPALPAPPAAPFAGMPANLPTAADLDLESPTRSAAESRRAHELEAELSFEFDLDLGGPAPADAADAPLPLPEVIEAPPGDAGNEILDLELDFGAGPAAEPLLHNLAPTRFGPETFDADWMRDPAGPPETPEAWLGEPDAAPKPPAAPAPSHEDEGFKFVGPLRIGIPLFNIYLNEADELSRRLSTELAEWAMELHRPIGDAPIALAHSLAGSSATVGFADLSQLARALEHAEARSLAIGHGTVDEARLFVDAAEEIRRLLHQFAAGLLKAASPELLERLAEHERSSAVRLDAASAAAELAPATSQASFDGAPESPWLVLDPFPPDPAANAEPEAVADANEATAAEARVDPLGRVELKPLGALPLEAPRSSMASLEPDSAEDDIDAVDAVDAELFPIFDEEAGELLPQLARELRDWARRPADPDAPAACMRTLHTLKGGARLAGAMRLGEMAHRLESRIEHLLAHPPLLVAAIEALQGHGDALLHTVEGLRSHDVDADTDTDADADADADAARGSVSEPAALAPLQALLDDAPPKAPEEPAPLAAEPATVDIAPAEPDTALAGLASPAAGLPPASDPAPIDWSRFAVAGSVPKAARERAPAAAQSAVRVRAPLLDRLVNQAGEVSITRSRIEASVGQIKGSLVDLTDNLERLRGQLREIEFQAESQMSSRLEAAKAASEAFDPLESDRFTRFQELTRMMAESVNDVATVQRTLQRSLESAEDELAAQARLTRGLQDDLLRTRMVEFEGLADRLYRVVRQAAKETGKAVRLDIVGGSIEVDRGVLDRMTGAFEHLLRNCVSHGIEAPEARRAAGKDATGAIIVALSHEGNEVGVEFRDDGAGLDLARIRARGVALGVLEAAAEPNDAELANLIFAPGFSTADAVTELAGRGVGMDVVRSEVNAMGGRIETATATGQGTSFKLILPLTTAVTRVLMLRCGDARVAVPSTLVDSVIRSTPAETLQAYASGTYPSGDRALRFFWLGALLQTSACPEESAARTRTVVVVRSAQQRVALHVDEVLGNQEVVVKNLGPQLASLPGLAGVTLLASGAVALIYNPVALATLYGDAARALTHAALYPSASGAAATPAARPAAVAPPLVLVVDDSLTVRRITQRLLVREGYRVVLAKDGLDALERLAGEELPRVVLSDIEMPRMDGFDLVRNLRADARLRELPVIMITSRIASKHREHAAALGVDHYLGKPYSEDELLALVKHYTAPAALPV